MSSDNTLAIAHNPNIENCRPDFRQETRRERYETKKSKAITYPVSLVTINLISEANVGMLIRSAVCFGLESVHVIGSMDNIQEIKKKSASTADLIKIHRYRAIEEFWRNNDEKYNFVALELTSYSRSIYDLSVDFSKPVCIIVGHEELGVPDMLLRRSEVIHIPMPGIGYCLNAAVAASVGMYEVVRQYDKLEKA